MIAGDSDGGKSFAHPNLLHGLSIHLHILPGREEVPGRNPLRLVQTIVNTSGSIFT